MQSKQTQPPNPQPLTHQQRKLRRKRIAQDIRNGLTVSEAARKYNLGRSTIETACREHNIPHQTNNSVRTPRQHYARFLQDIRHKRLDTKTLQYICKQYHLIEQVDIKHHTTYIPYSGYPIIADLINTNATFAYIAQQHNYTRAWVSLLYHICRRHNIPVQPRTTPHKHE